MTGQSDNGAVGGLTAAMFAELWAALGGQPADGTPGVTGPGVRFTNTGTLPSRFAVTDLAAATLGTVGAAVAELADAAGGGQPAVEVDRQLATEWCKPTARTVGGWASPGASTFTGAYGTRDGRWIRFQMNYVRQRAGTLATLGLDPAADGIDSQAVAQAVLRWDGE